MWWVMSFDKLVAQLDCSTPEDGTRVVLQDLPSVEGVVETNVIASSEAGAALTDVPSIPIDEARHTFVLGAMYAAENGIAMLHAMPDDAAVAMRADGRERRDGAFEAVEHKRAAVHDDLEAPVVVVAALRAFAHGESSSSL